MKSNLRLAVIDSITGAVLSPESLYAVLATERTLDRADADKACALAVAKGAHIRCDLLRVLCARRHDRYGNLPAQAVRDLADIFGFSVERDNDGQLVLYTDVKERKK